MGNPIEEIADAIGNAVADRTGKARVGFEPDVCRGCPQRGDGPLKKCGLCGCPTIRNGSLDLSGMAPEDCPRIGEHEQRGD